MSETNACHNPPTPGGAIDLCSPDLTAPVAAAAISQIFGDRATTIAAWCALEARQEGDEARYHLWLGAFKQLSSGKQSTSR